jgi:phage-related baseplate assembly protein
MSDILKIYTAEQLYKMFRDKILYDNVGITDFNTGSKVRSLIESNSDIISAISMDFKEAIYNAIPIALYQGFGFAKKTAVKATGYLRPYRTPAMIINYTGAGSNAKITIDSTSIVAACTGAPGDAFDYDFTTYPTISALAAQIESLTNWTCTAIKTGNSDELFQQADTEVINSLNYLYADGLDIMLQTDIEISIPIGFSVTLDQQQIITTAAATLLAGTAWILIAAQNQTSGILGNIPIAAIDTVNGKGYINSYVTGVEYVKNDVAFSGGSEAETDDARRIRFANTINALNAGTTSGLQAAILAINTVKSVGIIGSLPSIGMVTVIVDDGSGAVSPTLEAEVLKVIEGDPSDLINYPGKGTAGIGYVIIAPTIYDVDVDITVYVLSSVIVDYTVLETAIQSSIEQYINTLVLGADVLLSEITRVAKNTSSSVYDVVISTPATNITIDSTEMARTGAGTTGVVTVTVLPQLSI